MTIQDDYRRNAAKTVELVSSASSSADKGHLLSLAEKLAGRAHRTTRRLGVKPRSLPLVDAKLGIRRPDTD